MSMTCQAQHICSPIVMLPHNEVWQHYICFDGMHSFSFQLRAAASRQLHGLSLHPNLKQRRHLEFYMASFPVKLESLVLA